MEYRLTSCFIDINTYIISIRMKALINLLLNVLEHHIHRFSLMIGEIKVRSHMPLWNDKRMTW